MERMKETVGQTTAITPWTATNTFPYDLPLQEIIREKIHLFLPQAQK